MGACCSSPKTGDADRTPVYYYCPRTLEEHQPVSFTNGTSSPVTSGLYFNTNQDSSVTDALGAPPALAPSDLALTGSHTLSTKFGNHGLKTGHVQLTESGTVGEAVAEDENLRNSQYMSKAIDEKTEHESFKKLEKEPLKSSKQNVLETEEEDVCPTCLEEYDLENPRIITKCEHHFHLSCILEWMERSDTCPICDQIMMFDIGGDG